MQLRVFEFAEYAAITDDGKLVIGGVFNGVTAKRIGPPPPPGQKEVFPLQGGWLVWILEASLGDGLQHRAGLRVRDGNGTDIVNIPDLGPLNFILNQHGRPMRFHGRTNIGGLPIPGADDYEFELLVDGTVVGSVTLYVDMTS